MEKRAAELGAQKVGLHVFGHNPGARALYEGSGFATTSFIMSKRLGHLLDGGQVEPQAEPQVEP